LRKFIEYIKSCSANGGFLASPTYKPYQKVWLRDHSFVTLSLMEHGVNVDKEICWLTTLLKLESEKVRIIIEKDKGSPDFLNQELHPRARYSPDFKKYNDPWSERQYDGIALAYATVLKYENMKNERILGEELKLLYDNYFFKVFNTPCADLWEMHEEYIHAYTLGAIYYALNIRKEQVKHNFLLNVKYSNFLETLHSEIFKFEKNGVCLKMKKTLSDEPFGLDASCLLLFTLFDVIKDIDFLETTLKKIYDELSPDGIGLRRFIINSEKDTYFGGGVWFILNFWAAEAFMKLKNKKRAQELLQYRFRFPLPEQIIDDHLIFSKKGKKFWIEKSKLENDGIPGPAEPLTWSNSEFLRVSNHIIL